MTCPEQSRAQPYFDRFHWMVVHEPRATESYLLALLANHQQTPTGYLLHLPYRWSDERRIFETAFYIARDAYLRASRQNPARSDDLLFSTFTIQPLAERIAHRLVAARPFVIRHVARFGRSKAALAQAARSLGVPLASIRAVLHEETFPEAALVHRFLHEETGYPWLLPPELRDQYDPAEW